LSIFSKIAEYLFPERCFGCGKVIGMSRGLCPDCYREAGFISEPSCVYCGEPLEFTPLKRPLCRRCMKRRPMFTKNVSVMRYGDMARRIILPLKHADKTYIAKWMAELMFARGRALVEACDVVAPVPIHRMRMLKRFYNQSALIAGFIARAGAKKISFDGLVRLRNSPSQGHLGFRDRKRNVADAFAVKDPAVFRGKRILLIDDVMTSGATLSECAKALRACGASRVFCLTFAKVCD
jgi:ComF family protein